MNYDLKNIQKEILDLIPPKKSFEYNVIPLKRENGTLYIGVSDIKNLKLINDLRFETGLNIKPVELENIAHHAFIRPYSSPTMSIFCPKDPIKLLLR